MKVIKLETDKLTKLHIGKNSLENVCEIIHSDTIASAIMNNHLLHSDFSDEFFSNFPKISSAFPMFQFGEEEIFFFPKPVGLESNFPENVNKIKKIKFISENALINIKNNNLEELRILDKKYLVSLEEFEKYKDFFYDLLKEYTEQHVSISRGLNNEDSQLFQVSYLQPKNEIKENKKIKLNFFFLAENLSEKYVKDIKLIELMGLGGKRTVGAGKISNVKIYDKNFDFGNGIFMNLGLQIPLKEYISKRYDLIERTGFTYGISKDVRKKTILMFSEGSLFEKTFENEKLFEDVTPSSLSNFTISKFVSPVKIGMDGVFYEK